MKADLEMKLNRHSISSGNGRLPNGRLSSVCPPRTSAPCGQGEHSELKLQRENARLRQELEDLRCQHRQLVTEGPVENHEERRVNLLKAQLMQSERQVVLLSEGLKCHVSRGVEVEKALDALSHTLGSLQGSDSSVADVTVCRSELTKLSEMCASVRQPLHWNNKVNTVEGLAMPWVLAPPGLLKQPITLLDVCYQKTDSINLQHVSDLESVLSQLFKHLLGLKHILTHTVALNGSQATDSTALPASAPAQPPSQPPTPTPSPAPSPAPTPTPSPSPAPAHTPAPAPWGLQQRLLSQATVCLSALELCCTDLLPLTLLGAHSPQQTRSGQEVCVGMEAEDVLSLFPSLSRGAQQKARRAAQALTHAHNHAQRIAEIKLEAAEAELHFHRRLSSLQANQSQQLVQGLGHAYQNFQNNIQQSVCVPLQDILSCYDTLVVSASEEVLRDFLSSFERNQSELREALEALVTSQGQGQEALAQCGRDFLSAADRLRREWEEQKDDSAKELAGVQEAYDSALLHLDTLREERRAAGRAHTPGTRTSARARDTHMHARNATHTASSLPSDQAVSNSPPMTLPSNTHSALANDSAPHAAPANQSALLPDVASGVSRLSLSQQPRVKQRPANQRLRGKAAASAVGPPWQS